MTHSETAEVLALIDTLYPRGDWTDEIRAALAQRINKMDLSLEQARAVVTEYRMSTRVRTPIPKDLLDRLRAVVNDSRQREQASTPSAEHPLWLKYRQYLKLGHDTGMVEVFSCWYTGLLRAKLAAGEDAEWSRTAAWCGLVCELVRNGVGLSMAKDQACRVFGTVPPHIEAHAVRACGTRPQAAHSSSVLPALPLPPHRSVHGAAGI